MPGHDDAQMMFTIVDASAFPVIAPMTVNGLWLYPGLEVPRVRSPPPAFASFPGSDAGVGSLVPSSHPATSFPIGMYGMTCHGEVGVPRTALRVPPLCYDVRRLSAGHGCERQREATGLWALALIDRHTQGQGWLD